MTDYNKVFDRYYNRGGVNAQYIRLINGKIVSFDMEFCISAKELKMENGEIDERVIVEIESEDADDLERRIKDTESGMIFASEEMRAMLSQRDKYTKYFSSYSFIKKGRGRFYFRAIFKPEVFHNSDNEKMMAISNFAIKPLYLSKLVEIRKKEKQSDGE